MGRRSGGRPNQAAHRHWLRLHEQIKSKFKTDNFDKRNKWKFYSCKYLGPSRLHQLTRHLLGYFATRDLLGGGGGGVKRPHVITRERMAAERRTMRRSKALDETILKHPLNFPNEVTCQVKVRSKVKIGAFRLRAVETPNYQFWAKTYLKYSWNIGQDTDWVNVWY